MLISFLSSFQNEGSQLSNPALVRDPGLLRGSFTGQGAFSVVLEHAVESGPSKATHVSWDTFLN